MHEPTPREAWDDALEADDGAMLEEPEQRTLQISPSLHAQRLDKALASLVPEFSRSHLQALVATGEVRIDGSVCASSSRKVSVGQRLDVRLVSSAESRSFRPEAMPIDVVHEDADLMVVNKRAGWVVHPAAGNWSGTLLNALLAHHRGAAALPRAGIVHRLDKDTSGLLVVAKTLPAMTGLTRSIALRSVRREYRAIVHGEVEPRAFSVEAPIGRDPRVRVRMAVAATGKPARTDVFRLAVRHQCSALECTLHTGRTHQIRVHLASRGHPLVGDTLYGGRPALGLQRQALHAARLAFAHPVSAKALAFESEAPEDFLSAWRQIVA